MVLAGPLLVLISWPAASAADFEPKHACGLCIEVTEGHGCERLGACAFMNSSVVGQAGGCKAFCPGLQGLAGVSSLRTGQSLDLRVTKGFGTKAYDQIRISVVSNSSKPPVESLFDYSARFQQRWVQNYLHSAMRTAKPGATVRLDLGAGEAVDVPLPGQGQGISGLLMADPCISKGILSVGCSFGGTFHTHTRIPEIVNSFVPGPNGTDFWSILGDNFYDRSGDVSKDFFSQVSVAAKSKMFFAVAGNHDYWVLGDPSLGSVFDQCGHGFMQFYAQDTKASQDVAGGMSTAPFNFSISADRGHWFPGCNPAAAENFFWYNQIGNVGFVGQSGAYPLEVARPFMREACSWLQQQPGVEVAILLGHWDRAGLGASPEMAMPRWYEEMAALPGCKEFEQKDMLKFVMGHTHCNGPHPHGKVGAGFRVAGFGMEGCGNFGVPIVDTTLGRVRFWYFDTSSDSLYNSVLNCVQHRGWRGCTDMATLWLDEPIPTPREGSAQLMVL